MLISFSPRVTLNPQMCFGIESIQVAMLLACDKHEKMDASFWKYTAKERERESKAKPLEGHTHGRETPPSLMSICVASRGVFLYLRHLLYEAFNLMFCQAILFDEVPLSCLSTF